MVRYMKELENSSGYLGEMSSSQIRRQPRGGARTSNQERGEEAALWAEITQAIAKIKAEEKQFDTVIPDAIITKETTIADQLSNGVNPAITAIDELSKFIRDGVRVSETTAYNIKMVLEKITLLLAMVRASEAERGSAPREAHGRSSVTDFDGPADSPIPSPAENKHVRKIGNGRTSSLPPKGKDTPRKSENGESVSSSAGTKKIEFTKGQEVAFKPKPEYPANETDWIQGKVTRVIGEGKSRRYKVEDVAPDEGKQPKDFLTSASSMCPIPPDDAILGPYEVGKRVLALYPETTTFYRAEVKAMLDDGSRVRLVFDGDEDSTKEVERRFVLDHSG
ncbi:SAGA-associated factor 29 protein [Rutstroemia sp. NJR-2017a WRK4]|nr:SAGA-associated factor 29 protein [Rutstroemia sp. NJR-2017a WRK4]PQE26571.1 SAGA-associated factor 29 protein [Rutstroemia sp. NJR-2017a BBW]